MFLVLAFSFLILGIVAGTLSGLLGIGGGLIVVPGLLLLFKYHGFSNSILMHMAVGTSLAVMVVTTSRSLYAHHGFRRTAFSVYRKMMIGVIIGVIIGALFNHSLHSKMLEYVFGVFVILLAIKILFFSEVKARGHVPGILAMNLIGFLIGAKSGLLGLGGGAVTIPFLLYFNVEMRIAVVVSIMTSLTIATFGVITYLITGSTANTIPPYSTGYIHWPAWLGIIIGAIIFAPIGAKLSRKLPVQTLRKILALLLALIGAHLLF